LNESGGKLRKRSKVWKSFGRVKIINLSESEAKSYKLKIPNDSNRFYAKDIVGCIGCNESYVSKYGTSTLSKHKCIISENQPITKFTKINKKKITFQ
jgi:hypothetical protein